ncbi:MAG TPA: DnaB-like helicase C-terminal domain-containing protein [Deltaproteobacteria bacterium]|nr:DnaB-like helicase C-terminal domain-containing protein [Deltaproteobacteria bacterium]
MMSGVPTMMPNSFEYERAILSLLVDPTQQQIDKGEVFDALVDTDFYDVRNREMFKACRDLYLRKLPVDIISVPDVIGSAIPMPASYVSEVADVLPATDVAHYCDTLRDYSKARTAIAVMEKRLSQLRNIGGGRIQDTSELLDDLQREILLIDSRGRSKFHELSTLVSDAISRYREMNRGEATQQVYTGYNLIDEIVSFRGARLVIIAARPSVGKTAFALNIARNMVRDGNPVAFFELEMGRDDITDRLMAIEGDINLLQLVYGAGPSPDSWRGILQAGQNVYGWPMMIDDEGGLHVSELKRRIRHAAKCGAKAIFVDQLSQIKGPGRGLYEQNTMIVQELSRAKKEVNIPIFLLCQISRKQEDGGNKAPAMYMLKNTGSIEEEADIVMLIDRPYVYTRDESDKYVARIDVAKNRHGAPGLVELQWVPSRAAFKNKI